MFNSVLVANRGEIACRIIGTLRRLGIRSVAVYSDADRDARHVALADHAIRIGPPPAAESYLRIDAILEAAARAGAEAIHPGYGFLSENPAFARACAAAGVAFIGPPADVIEAMGAKDRAKALMAQAGVPLVPGYDGASQDGAALLEAARALGFPVLIKAAAGGGGRGMRVVADPADFAAALEGARREAASAFGDDRVLLERWLPRPRHVEAQVFGDRHGHIVHLFERDCSVQRRHQKVVEEAPAPGLSPAQRSALGDHAIKAARAIGYVNAGTVEFLMADGGFFFIEMNTRLQVEHPVTELVTGQDLVEWQLKVAAGEPLPLGQDRISLHGHAIEVRLYAEDPARGFLPSTGRLEHLRFPAESPGLRIDTGVAQGDSVSPFYDPMLAKIVAHGADRPAALRRLAAALAATQVVGPASNLDFLLRIARDPQFAAGGVDTGYLEGAKERLLAPADAAGDDLLAIAGLWILGRQQEQAATLAAHRPDRHSPWHRVDGWRLNDTAHQTLRFVQGERTVEVEARVDGAGWLLGIDGRQIAARAAIRPDGLAVWLDGEASHAAVVERGEQLHLFTGSGHVRIDRRDPLTLAAAEDEADGALSAPMPGKIVRQAVAAGERVARGAPLLVLEAMKMEHTISAPADGRVVQLHFREGDQVEEGMILIDFEAIGSH
ncbi:MAG TPA: biotin carboxylase N-terminal domain-containing protein [Geminicoccaceae bacterium]|nr:biotin carboxylase N-terminal domain-containing protein [Geminicoccaceae bacterium]